MLTAPLTDFLTTIAERECYRDNYFHTFVPVLESILDYSCSGIKVIEWGPGKNTEVFISSKKVNEVVSYESNLNLYNNYCAQFSNIQEHLSIFLHEFNIKKPVTKDVTSTNYLATNPYVMEPLKKYGQDYFDVAFIDGAGYRTDCAEISQAIVKDKGLIVWHDILSFRRNNPEFPSGRAYQDIFCNFEEYYYFDRHRTLLAINRKSSSAFNGDPFMAIKYKTLKLIFDFLLESGLKFVLLRNHGHIPVLSSIQNDIDILIQTNALNVVHDYLLSLDFTHYTDSQNPDSHLYGAEPHHHYINRSLDLHLDIVTGLYYASPNNGEKVAVCRYLQDSIFSRRQFVHDLWHFVPHIHDLFLHLFCHSLFDKQTVPYEYKILLEEIIGLTDITLLEKELQSVVYAFAPQALETISQRDTQKLHQQYYRFTGY